MENVVTKMYAENLAKDRGVAIGGNVCGAQRPKPIKDKHTQF